ncbi:MAG: LamG-like jellyroll fold domain-containing protein [Stenotrophomonas sp.]
MLRRLMMARARTADFAAEVAADNPYLWWRADESIGAALADSSGYSRGGSVSGTAGTDYTRGSPIIAGDGGSIGILSSSAGGRSNSKDFGAAAFAANTTFMVAVKINNSAAAGTILGLCDGVSPTGTTGSRDRIIALDTAGRLRAAVWSGAISVITSPQPINDGQTHLLHFAIGATAAEGAELYVDGVSVGTMSAISVDTSGSRYLYLGILNLSGWGSGFAAGAATALGRYQDVAVFSTRLSPTRIAAHAAAAGLP